MLTQGLFGDHEDVATSNMAAAFFSQDSSPSSTWSFPPPLGLQKERALQSLPSWAGDVASSYLAKSRFVSTYAASAEFGEDSAQRPVTSNWGWGDLGGKSKRSEGEDRLAIAAIKMKKVKGRRKVREPRFCFKTMSDVDVLDDGYKWRKYGQKVVKNTHHPRSYYRCTQENCRVKKRVERLGEDPRMVITTYEGRHSHSPSHDDQQDDNNFPHLPHHINFFS